MATENTAKKNKEPEKNPWPKRIQAWNKYSQKFHDRGTQIEARYQDDRESEANMAPSMAQSGVKKVNLFYSNTTVIKESLYNSLPKPSVSRLHKGDYENDAARVAAFIMERGLSYEVHCAKHFDPAVKAAILDRLVPGLGVTWITFVPPQGEIPETMTVDIVYWKDFIYEPKRAWEQVTWAGRILHMSNDEAEKKWPGKSFAIGQRENSSNTTISITSELINEGKTSVIQMWDKNKREVLHLTMTGEVLDRVKDPYELMDFYPCPKPLIASPPTSKFLPLPDYYIAQDQYMEMDILYARINLIIEAVKVAGVYDSATPELQRMLGGVENKLIPVDNWAMFAEKGGVKGVIDWFPVDQITTVLQQLIATYDFMKNQLFEVTGMADIVRGSTNQYETAAAQQIKAQFASVRMNAYQRDVSFFVRDMLRIMGELMVQMYSDQKLQAIVGTIPDNDQQFLAAAMQLLRSDFLLKYNIDIETDSLTQADWGLQQTQRMEFVSTLSQFIQGAMTVVESVPAMGPLMLEIIKFASVGFKGSSELEGMIDAAIKGAEEAANQPKPPDPEQVKMENETKMREAELAADQQRDQNKFALEQQKAQATMALEAQKQAAELQFMASKNTAELQFQAQKNAAELQFLRDKAAIEANIAVQKGQQQIEQGQIKNQQAIEQGAVRSALQADQAHEAAEGEKED
jgi:hypothetical protein